MDSNNSLDLSTNIIDFTVSTSLGFEIRKNYITRHEISLTTTYQFYSNNSKVYFSPFIALSYSINIGGIYTDWMMKNYPYKNIKLE